MSSLRSGLRVSSKLSRLIQRTATTSTSVTWRASSSSPAPPHPFPAIEEIRENLYNPYRVAENPEDAKELEPPVRYYRDARFDEPDYAMPENEALAIYSRHHPDDLFTNFEESEDPVEWSYVEHLLGAPTIPTPPPHPSYPTPSGWMPPDPDPTLEWFVRRKKDHHFDIRVDDAWKTKARAQGGFKVTYVGNVEGDIWAFVRAAKSYLLEHRRPPTRAWERRRETDIETQVNEAERVVGFAGIFDEQMTQFLFENGM